MNAVLFANKLYTSKESDKLMMEAINKFVDSDLLVFPLNESIELAPQFSNYIPLIESIEELKDIENDIKDAKNETDLDKKGNILSRLTKSIKKLIDWWYKIEPDKKFNSLRSILKILLSALVLILSIKNPKMKEGSKRLAKKLPVGTDNKPFDIGMIGKDSAKTIAKSIFSKETIAASIIAIAFQKLLEGLEKIDKLIEYNVNKEDLDKNIKYFDETIDKINDMIEVCDNPDIKKELIKSRENAKKSLARLTYLKDEFER